MFHISQTTKLLTDVLISSIFQEHRTIRKDIEHIRFSNILLSNMFVCVCLTKMPEVNFLFLYEVLEKIEETGHR